MPRHLTLPIIVTLGLALGACDSDGDSPTKPSPTITVTGDAVETFLDQIAVRVAMTMTVRTGLEDLTASVQAGQAQAEVCVSATCNTAPIVPGPAFGQCDTAVGLDQAEVAGAWLAGDVVAVSFCVPTLTTAQVYETTLLVDGTRSNTIQVPCQLDGAFLACTLE